MTDNQQITKPKGINKFFRGLNLFRIIVLNVVFFILLYYVLAFVFRDNTPKVPDSTVLVLAPAGTIVDEVKVRSISNLVQNAYTGEKETLLKDMLDAIDEAKTDSRVKVLLLKLDEMGNSGLTKLQDLKAALDDFKKTGKKVIAMSDTYSRDSYYLAACADEVYLHPMGSIMLGGYSRMAMFYKDGLDKYEIDVHVFRVGKYKSAVEPYMRGDMSPEAKEANLAFLSSLWQAYIKDVSSERKLPPTLISDYSDRANEYLKETNGDPSALALKLKLVTGLMNPDELDKRLTDIVGEDSSTHRYRSIGFKDYLTSLGKDRWGEDETGDVVGVIVAAGSILDGKQAPGNVGGDSTAELIRKARLDSKVKAIVLKVDSPGGSSFGSEIVRRELEVARQNGKPVVISMGTLAASGGYWISTPSDEIWAYPTTITGSIGIYGFFPTFQKPLEKYLGVKTDGVGTSKISTLIDPTRPLTPEAAQIFQLYIDKGYNQFVNLVSKSRKKTYDQVHEIAQGRVWIGADAFKLGLVDHLGTFKNALDSAAKRGKLGNNYKIKYFRQELNWAQKLLMDPQAKALESNGIANNSIPADTPINRSLENLLDQVKPLFYFNDPNGMYAFCMEARYY